VLVFIDESGDPGFKLERGSSPVFVVAMVIFQTSEVPMPGARDDHANANRHGIDRSEALARCVGLVMCFFPELGAGRIKI
jgi:hypothetical protein